MAVTWRFQALLAAEEAQRQAEEAERVRRASIEYRQAVARQQWAEALDAKEEREAALQGGLPLVAQELQSVVLRGMRSAAIPSRRLRRRS